MESQTKYLLIGLGVIAAGAGGYLLYKHFRSKADEQDVADFADQVNSGTVTLPDYTPPPATTKPKPSGSSTPSSGGGFPLKRGSRGSLVKDLQNALIRTYGKAILPKYGADGDFGKETSDALAAKGLPAVIDSQTFAKIVAGNATPRKEDKKQPPKKDNAPTATAKSLATQLHKAIDTDDIFKALDALKKIKNKDKYIYVNEEFKKTRYYTFADGYVSRTVVNALLDQFTSAEYKKKINAELYRIGLKYDGSKWSLSGLSIENRLITTEETHVFATNGRSFIVPASTSLGYFRSVRNGMTVFESIDGQTFYVSTKSIKYHD